MKNVLMASYKLDGAVVVKEFEGYASKNALAKDIRRNGGKVRVIAEPENFDEATRKYNEANERHAAGQKSAKQNNPGEKPAKNKKEETEMTLSKKEELIKARDEWEARNAEQEAKYDAQYGAFRNMTWEILDAIERKVAEGLGRYSLNLEIKADARFRERPEVSVNNEQNRDDSNALRWSWKVRIDENGAPAFESSSWSGLCATTIEQVQSLKETACALEILMGMDWAALLNVELPDYEKLVTEKPSIGNRLNFEAEIRAAEIAEMIGQNTLVKGTRLDERGEAWYLIVSESPKQFKVAEVPAHWLKDKYLQEHGMTLAQAVGQAKKWTTKVAKEKLLGLLGNPIETMTF